MKKTEARKKKQERNNHNLYITSRTHKSILNREEKRIKGHLILKPDFSLINFLSSKFQIPKSWKTKVI